MHILNTCVLRSLSSESVVITEHPDLTCNILIDLQYVCLCLHTICLLRVEARTDESNNMLLMQLPC